MTKYICLCGSTFKDKSQCETHIKIREHQQDAWCHKIFKQHWQARLATWFLTYQWVRFTRFVGAYMVYIVFINHFNIDWNWIEAGLIGLGMGLYID